VVLREERRRHHLGHRGVGALRSAAARRQLQLRPAALRRRRARRRRTHAVLAEHAGVRCAALPARLPRE
jgi:hypothetical protein